MELAQLLLLGNVKPSLVFVEHNQGIVNLVPVRR
jgi:hypothetical protein